MKLLVAVALQVLLVELVVVDLKSYCHTCSKCGKVVGSRSNSCSCSGSGKVGGSEIGDNSFCSVSDSVGVVQ